MEPFTVFWAQKGVVELISSVPNSADSDQTCLFVTYISSNISGSFH